MKSKDIILKNYYVVKAMPKTKAKGFDTVKVGDVIEISLPLTYGRGRGLYAYYPCINGVACAGIPLIQSLMNKGMILEEVVVNE
jgi:hypothetical protein